MLKKIINKIKKEQFQPGLLGIFVNPFYFARKGLIKGIIPMAEYIRGRTLDVGCGKKPYKEIFHSSEYIGLEIDTPENRLNKKADVFYDGKNFPFNNEEFDSVVINQVFEHVFNPDNFLKETGRILKKDGMLLITVPFVWDEHEKPYDYARYSSYGLKHILGKYGFKVIKEIKTINDIRLVFQLLICYIYKLKITKNRYADMFITFIIMVPFNILGEILSKILPKNNDLYLDNIVLAQKVDYV